MDGVAVDLKEILQINIPSSSQLLVISNNNHELLKWIENTYFHMQKWHLQYIDKTLMLLDTQTSLSVRHKVLLC